VTLVFERVRVFNVEFKREDSDNRHSGGDDAPFGALNLSH
jgi:hypothetical protein